MAPLPEDRLKSAPPFTYVGVDLLGPFLVKRGRKEVKNYGAIFTCLNSQTVHIEISDNLETVSSVH